MNAFMRWKGNRLNNAEAGRSHHIGRSHDQFFKRAIEAFRVNAACSFTGMLTTDYILVVGDKIVKKTFGNTTDGKKYQQ